MPSQEAEAMGYAEPRRAYQIIRASDGKLIYEKGYTPDTDESIIASTREPVLIWADKQHGGTGPYLYQIKDDDADPWRTVREYN